MPRKARITVVGAVHHIMSRGIEGRMIFTDDEDRFLFLNYLENVLKKSGYLLYAWCLMGNHYHLLIRISDYPLGVFMRHLNGQYAQYFRKKSNSRGYLFQDRYKSIVTQDQLYIEEIVRYIHLNPIKGGMCKSIAELDAFPWSGHTVLIGKKKMSIQNVHDVLKRFDSNEKRAIRKYRLFLQEGMKAQEPSIVSSLCAGAQQSENIHNTGCWVIGNKEFIAKAVAGERAAKTRLAQHAKEGISIHEVAKRINKKFGLREEEIKKRGRKNTRSMARKFFAYTCYRQFQFPVIQIARYLGVSSPSVSNLISEGEALAKKMNRY